MLHTVPEPELSPDFTMEDIRKIREWQYAVLKDATWDEFKAFMDKEAQGYCRAAAQARGTAAPL